MKRPTDDETDGMYWQKRLDGWHIIENNSETSLCGDKVNVPESEEKFPGQPLIPEDDPDPETDCVECCHEAGFENFGEN